MTTTPVPPHDGAQSRGTDRPEPVDGILAAAAGMTLLVGLASTILGGGHLLGVIVTATRGVYRSYDFRFAALLIIGIMMVVAGTLCIVAVGGLARGRRRAWDHAMGGTLLLLLVTVPLVLVPVQGTMAAGLAFLAALNLVALVAVRGRPEDGSLEAQPRSVGVADELAKLAASRDTGTITSAEFDRQRALVLAPLPPSSSGLRCGKCGQALSQYWRDRCGVCKTPFTEVTPVQSS